VRHLDDIPRVVLDADVLVHAWTTDVILSLADAGLLEPVWSPAIMDEALKAICRVRPKARKQALAYLGAMRAAFPLACQSAEVGMPDVVLPDPNDLHVVGTALIANAQAIVTYNTKDFPPEALSSLGIVALSPDRFLTALAEEYEGAVLTTMRSLISQKHHPPRTSKEESAGLTKNHLDEYARTLERLGL